MYGSEKSRVMKIFMLANRSRTKGENAIEMQKALWEIEILTREMLQCSDVEISLHRKG